MKNILFLFALLFSISAYSQTSLGIKAGIITFNPYRDYVSHPVAGIVFKYAPKRIGFGIEPSITFKRDRYYSVTDIYGKRLPEAKSEPILELPAYIFVKVIDKGFKLNIEAGSGLYGSNATLSTGFYAGFQTGKILIGLNYRFNKIINSEYPSNYHTPFASIQYTF